MASVLTLSPHDNLGRLCSRTSYHTGSTTPTSTRSAGTVLRPQAGSSPAPSCGSAINRYAQSWRQTLADLPARNMSVPSAIDRRVPRTTSLSSTALSTRSAISDTLPQPPRLADPVTIRTISHTTPVAADFKDPARPICVEEVTSEDESWYEARNYVSGSDESAPLRAMPLGERSIEDAHKQSFHHWMERLRRRRSTARAKNRKENSYGPGYNANAQQRGSLDVGSIIDRHRKSDSMASSSNMVYALRSASVTIASSSLASLKHTSRVSPRSTGSPATRILSASRLRRSIDSVFDRPIDEMAQKRGRKRYEKIQELLRTEEGYLADLKALCNVLRSRQSLLVTSLKRTGILDYPDAPFYPR